MMDGFPLGALAVVGMDASWGGSAGLDAFERAVYGACGRPQGGLDAAGLAEAVERAALNALADAGILPGGRLRVALAAAANGELGGGWGWACAFLDLSRHPNPLAGALEYAAGALARGEADAVVFAAASRLEPGLRAGAGGEAAEGGPLTLGFDRAVHAAAFGAGAGAVVLSLPARAAQGGLRAYALVRALAVRPGGQPGTAGSADLRELPLAPALEDLRGCCQDALRAAGVSPGAVGYVEAFASGVDALDGVEIAGLAQAYRADTQDLATALGSVQAQTGFLGPAAGLAGLVRAALCLYRRFLPGAPGWNGPKLPALWRGAPFYVPADSRPWFAPSDGPPRLAGLSLVGRGGSCAHALLQEPPGPELRPNQALALGGFFLFPLAGGGQAELERRLLALRNALEGGASPASLAAEWARRALEEEGSAYALAVAAHSAEEALREIDLALKALPAAFARGGEWQTPLGSYFTAVPAGKLGHAALVYPGAFNTYPGVGKDLLRLFPSLAQRTASLTADLGRVLRERMLFPRGLRPFTKEELAAQEAALLGDPITMLITGTALAVMYTHILQEGFGVRPAAAFGYSLGENSMLYAAGVWSSQGDEAAARLEHSAAFRERLAGPQLAVREFWGLPAGGAEAGEPLWSNFLAMAASEQVQEALLPEPKVSMTHINTPRQVVIGGDPRACRRVLSALGCASLQAPFEYALHCAPMRSEFAALADLHSYPVENDPGLRLYSAAQYAPLDLDQRVIAESMARMLTSPLDFPRLVRAAYVDGARVFIEAGAGANCARWIDETLKGEPHLALSMNRRGTDDYHTLVRMAARLFSHRVPLRLSALYEPGAQGLE